MASFDAHGIAAGSRLKADVYVLDDSPEMCRSLEALLSSFGYTVQTFTKASAFLSASRELRSGVLLVDLRMEEMDGIEVLEKLKDQASRFPGIMITGHGDIEVAVKAIKSGARDFIQKPFRENDLVETIEHVAKDLLNQSERAGPTKDMLTGRERAVADRLAEGLSNKQIAYDLGISVRTVEMHRARAMQRLGCKSFADLLRLLLAD